MLASPLTFNEALEIGRLNARLRELRVVRFVHRVDVVDAASLHAALETIGDAWESRSCARYRSALSYAAGVEFPTVDVRAYLAGRDAWQRAGLPIGARFAITPLGRATLAATEEGV